MSEPAAAPKPLVERFGWIEPVIETGPDGKLVCPPAAGRVLSSLAGIVEVQERIWRGIRAKDQMSSLLLLHFTGRLG